MEPASSTFNFNRYNRFVCAHIAIVYLSLGRKRNISVYIYKRATWHYCTLQTLVHVHTFSTVCKYGCCFSLEDEKTLDSEVLKSYYHTPMFQQYTAVNGKVRKRSFVL